MPTYSFECEYCGQYYEEYFPISNCPQEVPCSCGEYAHKIIAYAPSLGKGTKDGTFKPYFDQQLNQHFQSADEKRSWLKANDYVQYSGPSCPSEDKPGNFQCTKSQAKSLTKKPTTT